MDIILCKNNSEPNKINKNISNLLTLSGNLKEDTSILNPVVLIEIEDPAEYNYTYIPEFNRYYFINDIVSVRNGIWRISMTVDVLMSFKSSILTVPVILSDTEYLGSDMYLPGQLWKTKVTENTNITNLPSGLSENGHFILITAGG